MVEFTSPPPDAVNLILLTQQMKKRNYKYEREQGEVSGIRWRKETYMGNDVITLQSKKMKEIKISCVCKDIRTQEVAVSQGGEVPAWKNVIQVKNHPCIVNLCFLYHLLLISEGQWLLIGKPSPAFLFFYYFRHINYLFM